MTSNFPVDGDRRFFIDPVEARKRQNQKDNDHYVLTDAFTPSPLMQSLARAGRVLDRPILLVYRGKESGHVERFELHSEKRK